MSSISAEFQNGDRIEKVEYRAPAEFWKKDGTSGNSMKMFQELYSFAIDAGLDSVSVRGTFGTPESRGLLESLSKLPGFTVSPSPSGKSHIITFSL